MRIDLDWLLEVLTIPHPIYNMMAGNINISKFCATVSHVISDSSKCDTYTLTSLLERGEHLDLMFSQWFNSLPNNRLPRKAQSPTGESIILYPDSTSAGVWNYYRGTRIILQRVILQIHRSLEILVLGNAFTSGTFLPRNPEEIIVEMIGEICESIPFSLGDLDIFGQHTPDSSYGKVGIKAVQGFALMWPLFSVPQSGYATQEQESQAREALRRIATTHGIRMGIVMSLEEVQLGRSCSSHSSASGQS
ncbi:uncharacterized protein PFLUO_LOCUS6307 [Penicillium psychrofluorescens]|uniref:uncharacterized protein n=1 Tax=Penicillium psychrofluorescens TaxID=3158075 RepID=UPI003CCDDBAE